MSHIEMSHVTHRRWRIVCGGVFRWGWAFLERTRILSQIHFTRHFIEFVVVETKKFVSSKVNVILTRQACGQCSCMSSGSKHRALEIYLDKRICHMFTLSKCWEDWDLGLCTFWVLAKRELLRNAQFRFFPRAKHDFFSKVATAQRFFFRRYLKSSQT